MSNGPVSVAMIQAAGGRVITGGNFLALRAQLQLPQEQLFYLHEGEITAVVKPGCMPDEHLIEKVTFFAGLPLHIANIGRSPIKINAAVLS